LNPEIPDAGKRPMSLKNHEEKPSRFYLKITMKARCQTMDAFVMKAKTKLEDC